MNHNENDDCNESDVASSKSIKTVTKEALKLLCSETYRCMQHPNATYFV